MEEWKVFGPNIGLSEPKRTEEKMRQSFFGKSVGNVDAIADRGRYSEVGMNRERQAKDSAIREAIINIAGCIPSEKGAKDSVDESKDDLGRLVRFLSREVGSEATERGGKKTNVLKALMVTVLMSGPGSMLLQKTVEAETVQSSKKIERTHHQSSTPRNLAVKEDVGSWERMERRSDIEWDDAEKRNDREWDTAEKQIDKDWDAMEKRMEKSAGSGSVINEADW
ncbi:MAG: hypothetical protein HGA31_05120 [Candidatus Moranbacteria bacterium]|nr:hypothetical protein [Candidatus Moranbacteria bacterium]